MKIATGLFQQLIPPAFLKRRGIYCRKHREVLDNIALQHSDNEAPAF